MQPLKPIFWHQGLFLQPQHFQYLETYVQSFQYPLLKCREHDFWGVLELEINSASLNDFIFEVLRGEFIFKDRTWISLPGNARLKRRSFESAWLDPDKPFQIYLGLKRLSKDEKNIRFLRQDEELSDDLAIRFVCQENPEEIPDLFDPAAPYGQVKKMDYLLKIFWETELEELADYELIPLARLIREGNEIKLAEDFVPPCLTLASSRILLGHFKAVRDQITSRCKQLEEFKSPKEMQTAEFDAQYMVYLLALRSLNRYVPLLYSYFEQARTISPRSAYVLLTQLVGELSTFTQRINALSELEDGTRLLPPYRHDDPQSCFAEANRLIWELLNEIIIGPEHIIKLQRDDFGWKGDLPPESLDLRNTFYLVLHTALDISSLLDATRNLVKVCSLECALTLVARALPGIPLEHVDVPPPGLPRKAHSHYFRIARENPLWEHVEKDKNIALIWDECPEDLKAEIVVLKK